MQMVMPLRRKRSDDGPALHPVPPLAPDGAPTDAENAEGAPGAPVAAQDVGGDAVTVSDAETAPEHLVVSVQRIELGSLAWVALRTALVVATIGALAVLALWTLADVGGLVDRFDSFMRSIGVRNFHLAAGDVLMGLVVVVAGLALTAAAFAVIAGATYNLLAATGGGIHVRIGPATSRGVAGPVPADPAPTADHPVRGGASIVVAPELLPEPAA